MALCKWCRGADHPGGCDREQLRSEILRLRKDLDLSKLEVEATKKVEGTNLIMIRSLISHRTSRPKIDIQVGEVHSQIDAMAAVDVALNIIQTAIGSFADGYLFHFMKEELEQSDEIGALMIQQFRTYREKLQKEFDANNKETSGS